jgi:D-methionine transport system ATP-binding protein
MSANPQERPLATSHPIVEIASVNKRYRTPHGKEHVALKDINLSLERGTIQGVIGFSGAGKSTLLRCISRLEQPDAGHVLIEGEDLAQLSGERLRTARRKIGVVFQQFHLLRSRNVEENIALPLELAGARTEEIRHRVSELIEWFGLVEHATHYPSQLSGGQQQRVAIARALANRPAVLLSDEPTSALDAETTASVLELLRRVRDEFGVTILLITHELDAVRAICDRVAVLENGGIVEEGPIEQVLLCPRSSAAMRLIGDAVDFTHIADYIGAPENHIGAHYFQLLFRGPGATEPVLSDVSRRTQIVVNILNSRIGSLRGQAYGLMLVEMRGDETSIATALDIFAQNGVAVDVVNPWSHARAQEAAQ